MQIYFCFLCIFAFDFCGILLLTFAVCDILQFYLFSALATQRGVFLCPFVIPNFSSTFVVFNPKTSQSMKTKDKQDEAQRHARRDAIIRAVFHQLVYHENYSFECAYIFIGNIWGLGRSKIAQIVSAKDECPLSGYDLSKLAVILHRISKYS